MVTRAQRVESSAGELSSPLGHYRLHDAVSVGTSTSVHIGILEGAEGVRRTVAIKRLVPAVVHEQAAHAELTYEACVGALVHHPNVLSALDLGTIDHGPFLAMEYVLGEGVAVLLRAAGRFPVAIAVAIMSDALRGLHAAHIAADASGEPLDIVHQNVSPENILVGVDGVARIIDFGSAVSAIDSMTIPKTRLRSSRAGVRSPEQTMGWPLDARTDVFAAAVVLWELMAGARPFRNHGAMQGFLSRPTRTMPPASAFNVEVTPELEAVMDRALSWSPAHRFDSAIHFAEELEALVQPASRADVGRFVEQLAATRLAAQRKVLDAIGAPYGRMSSAPPKARRAEPEMTPSMGPDERAARRALRRARFMGRLATLRSSVAKAFRPTRWARPPSAMRSISSWAVPAGDAIIRHGSTVLTALSLVCLLLAAVGATPGHWRRHAAFDASASVSKATETVQRIGRDPADRPPEDECTAMPPPPAPPSAAVAPPSPVPVPAAAAPVVPPPAAPAAAAMAHEPPAPRREAVEERDRPRPRPAPRRESASSCDPPFTIDEGGIRRIKIDCL